MESNISDRFISETILKKLKETLQAQSSLPQNDLSIQLSCMQASTSTLLEVKNILAGLGKESIRNVADNIAGTDGHFILQRYLIKSYYLMQSNGTAADIMAEAEESRPSGMLIFCPLYVAVTEVLTNLLVSRTFAGNLASTKILELLLQDLNVLVLPSPMPDQFKMLLANIHFLWEMGKNPATSAHFRNFSDTVLILINVFVSYEGPLEQLTTLVKSLAMFIAAQVADDETSVYLLAEESCLDFIVDILANSVSTGEKYLNYQGVYAVDVAKCIENLSRFDGLQEVLLGKGVVELLVSMIQIGDPYDDSAAARALNALMQTYKTVDVPVLFHGLASYCDNSPADSSKSEVVVISGNDLVSNKQEVTSENSNQREHNAMEGGRLANVKDKEMRSFDENGKTMGTKEKMNTEMLEQNVNVEGNTVDNTDVSGSDFETVVDTEMITASQKETLEASSMGRSDCDILADWKKETGTEVLKLKDDITEDVVENIGNESNHEKDGKQICDQENQISCDEATATAATMPVTVTTATETSIATTASTTASLATAATASTTSVITTSLLEERKTKENPREEFSPQTSTGDTTQTHKIEQQKEQTLSQQEDISAYLREQLKTLEGEGIKYIQIPAQFEPDIIKQPEPVCRQPQAERPFHYQQAGTDPVSGQNLHDIHMSLIDLGVHNMYDAKLVGLLNQILEETKLREDGIFDILNCVPKVYSYKMLKTGSMQRQLRVVPAHNEDGVNAPLIHVQPEIDYHLVLKKFVFQTVPDHGSKMDFPGFSLIGPWVEKIPEELEEWSFCFVPHKSDEGKIQYFLSADRLKKNFLCPILLSFVHMNMQYRFLMAKGETLEQEDLKRHGITVRKIEENGPAVTVYYFYKYLTVDYVLSLRHIQWPSCAAEWQGRQRQWPDSHTVKDVVTYGCHLVLKQPPSLSQEDPLYGMFFQYSFARAENILLNKLNDDNPVLTDCLRMLKFLCEMHFDRPCLLKSYHMQTLVLLAAERLPPSHWKADNFVKHLLDLLDDLLHCLVMQNLPNYFIPQQNLLQQFSPDFILDVAVRVSKVRQNPIKYLAPSGDPSRFGVYLI